MLSQELKSNHSKNRQKNAINHISATRFIQVLIRTTEDYIHLANFPKQRFQIEYQSAATAAVRIYLGIISSAPIMKSKAW